MEEKEKLIKALIKTINYLTTDFHLKCIAGSYGDTQSDSEIIEMLEQFVNGKRVQIISESDEYKRNRLGLDDIGVN